MTVRQFLFYLFFYIKIFCYKVLIGLVLTRKSKLFLDSETDKMSEWSDVWSNILCSAFNPSKYTHAHTHTVNNSHLEQWAANAAVPGEQLGAWREVERALVIHSLHRQFLPDKRLEPASIVLQVRLSIHLAMTDKQVTVHHPYSCVCRWRAVGGDEYVRRLWM